jgi:D-alanyl-lipoteichoic acid acyltransferase DltB (MBOAT superfamily)
MGFNSLAFLVFAPIAIAGNWLLRGRALRLWMVVASYLFYGWAVPWYCVLLFASTVLDFGVGRALGREGGSERARRGWLAVSLTGNLGLLAAFKYAALIATSVNGLVAWGGGGFAVGVPDIPLPVGISFYTFQTLSYTIDVYRRRLAPTSSFTTFALYVAFFPQLVAGPIERAAHLLPQLAERRQRTADDLLAGTTRILWGLMKKLAFADNLALYVDSVYGQVATAAPIEVLLATYAFTFQLYLDFSAYSDIAIGLSRTMGIDLLENFNWPYLARSPAEYWQRWHISLSTWIRDYLFRPLSGRRPGTARFIASAILAFALAGLWHGASWKFVLWGLYIGLWTALVALYAAMRGKHFDSSPDRPFHLSDVAKILVTFHIFCVSKLVFRAQSVAHAGEILGRLAAEWALPAWQGEALFAVRQAAVLTVLAAVVHVLRGLGKLRFEGRARPAWQHGAMWAAIALVIAWLYPGATERFIYFQF